MVKPATVATEINALPENIPHSTQGISELHPGTSNDAVPSASDVEIQAVLPKLEGSQCQTKFP
ncbi:hypothetical protein DSO57_1038820 [Entomophthora muscae]|uniref:Uncharacterized protein n=1 Tax=Entomophthora muscae TaxID=34485 RepID=A0ACC2TWI2_9FUNG|nr:hypothetical protein DSO57_1038820 [Entomophthora muscae]